MMTDARNTLANAEVVESNLMYGLHPGRFISEDHEDFWLCGACSRHTPGTVCGPCQLSMIVVCFECTAPTVQHHTSAVALWSCPALQTHDLE